MSLIRVSGDKAVREEAKILMGLGFEFSRCDGRDHPVFAHPVYGEIGLSRTPGDGNWRRPHRRKLAALMGITVRELEQRITGQAPGKRSNTHRPPRKRRAPNGLRHLRAAPPVPSRDLDAPETEAEAVSVTFAPDEPITDQRRAQWAALEAEQVRANLANPYPWRRAA